MTFDWSFVQRYAPFFVNGTLMILFISVFGILRAIAVGLVCAGVEIARIPVAQQIVRIYIELSPGRHCWCSAYFHNTSACPKLPCMVRRNLRDSRPWILGRFLHGGQCAADWKRCPTCSAKPRTCWD